MKKLLAIVLVMALTLLVCPTSMLGVIANAENDYYEEEKEYTSIQIDEEINVSLYDGQYAIFSFTPSESGNYVFYSIKANCDPYCTVYDSKMSEIAYDDDSGDEMNFNVFCTLEAGETYYFYCYSYSYYSDFCVKLEMPDPATSLDIISDIENGYVGESLYIDVVFLPVGSFPEEITWTSDNEKVAYVEYENQVCCVSEGTATITATTESGLTDSVMVVVSTRPAISEIEICSNETNTFYINTSYGFGLNIYPYNAGYERIYWSTSDEKIATVDDEGRVAFLSPGIVNIIATTENGVSDSCEVTVLDIPEITVDQPACVTIVNNGEQFFKFIPEKTAVYRFYTSDYSNTNRAGIFLFDEGMNWLTYTFYGYLDCELTEGETYYIATYFTSYHDSGNGMFYLNIAELVPATSISFDIGSEYEGYVDTWKQIEILAEPEVSSVPDLEWTSSDPDVVFVNDSGEMHLLAIGSATITATSENGLTYSCVVNVVDFDSIELNEIRNVFIESESSDYVYFTPEEDGYYAFYSFDNDYDTFGNIFTLDMDIIASDDDSGEDTNFRVKAWLEGGVTYVLNARFYNTSNFGEMSVCVEKTKSVVGMELVSMPNKTEYIYGIDKVVLDFSGLKLRLIWSDGTTTDWTYRGGWEVQDGYIYGNYDDFWENGEVHLSFESATLTLKFTFIENPVERIELVSGTERVYIEHFNGRWDYNENGKFFYYETYHPYDAVIEIIYKDGTSITADIDDYIDGYGVEWTTNQYNKPWVVGSDNESYINYLGHSVLLPITVISNPVKSIEVISGKITCVENTNGEESDGVFYYDFSMPNDVIVKITYNDGTSKNVNICEKVDGYWFDWYSEQHLNPWTLGDDNYLIISYLGVEGTLPVSVIENPVERIELVSGTEEYYIENYDGQWEYNEDEEFFYYNTYYPRDAVINIIYKDGTSELANVGDYINGYEVSWSSEQYQNPWVLGDDNVSYVEYLGFKVVLPITVISNPVERIELVSGTEKYYIENYDGRWEYNKYEDFFCYNTHYPRDAVVNIIYKDGTSELANVGDYINGYEVSWSSEQYQNPWVLGDDNVSYVEYLGFKVVLPITVISNPVKSIEILSGKITCLENAYGHYYQNNFIYYYDVPEDVEVKINYNDGTSKIVNIQDEIDGYWFDWSSDQYENPWTLGDDNHLVISYLGMTDELPVSVIANPVDYIEILTAPTREYIYGDIEWGYLYDDGQYDFYPTDLTGLSFIVYYKDGTTKTYSYKDIYDGYYIDGYAMGLSFKDTVSIGNIMLELMYMGKVAEYSVVLKESNVKSVEVIKQPDNIEFETYFYPDFIGTEIKITYVDGTTKVVKLTEDNIRYECYSAEDLVCIVEVDGYLLAIQPNYDIEGLHYRAQYLGAQCIVAGFEYSDIKKIDYIEVDNVTPNGDGMRVTVVYIDGTKETLVLDMVTEAMLGSYDDGEVYAFAKTEKGIVWYFIMPYVEDDGSEYYYIYILGEDCHVQASATMIGDVNGNGEIEKYDYILLKRAVMGTFELNDTQSAAADVNGNGTVEKYDYILVKRHVMGTYKIG